MRFPELTLLALLSCIGVASCDVDEGPAEEAGESLDEAGDEIGDEVDDATDDDGAAQAMLEEEEGQLSVTANV
jgi:hypothetical protein